MQASAAELNKHPGKYINQAIKGPVVVKRSGYPVVVIVSYERYMQLEDAYWGELSKEADKEKSLGKKATMDFLQGDFGWCHDMAPALFNFKLGSCSINIK